MSRLPSVTATELLRRLKKAGFRFDRQAAGSHQIWFNESTTRWVSIPVHRGRSLKRGTLRRLLRDAGISPDEFDRLK